MKPRSLLIAVPISLSILTSGCEDVVDMDLNHVEPKLVIEGLLYEYRTSFYLRQTTDFYAPSPYGTAVSGALIILSNEMGSADTLVELSSAGSYVPQTGRLFPFVTGRRYFASVAIDGQLYHASTTVPAPMPIDSLSVEYQEGGGFGTEEEAGYRLHVFFTDPADHDDYALIDLGDDYYYLYDGRYSDGNIVDYDYFLFTLKPYSYVGVQLRTMDRVTYEYFQTLAEVYVSSDLSDFTDATPSNPNSNWSGGALGYFGAFRATYKSIKTEP